jgi:hypothetical protein
MRFRPLTRERPVESLISQYGIGQRVVELVRLADGCTRWVCNCESYQSSAGSVQGPWCKHVAKAAAIRSIERLTGERVISRATAYPAQSEILVRAQPSPTARGAGVARDEVPAGAQRA